MKPIRRCFCRWQSRLCCANLAPSSGFSIPELLTVVVIAGLLAGMVAPGWLAFARNRILNAAQDQAFQAFRQAQRVALQQRIQEQVSFRQTNNSVEWATHSADSLPQNWQTLQMGVQIDLQNTTLSQSGGVYRMQFNELGNANGQLGRLTFSIPNSSARRCVFVSTLLGTLRKAQNEACQQP